MSPPSHDRGGAPGSPDGPDRAPSGGTDEAATGRTEGARGPGPAPQGRRARAAGRQSLSALEGSLLDPDDLARRLNVTSRFVRRLVAERRIPFVKIGRSVRFDPADVDAWVEQAKVPVTTRRHAGGTWSRGGAA